MTTIRDATARFRPATAVERELLAECVQAANGPDGCLDVGAVLGDAIKFWMTAGRSISPRLWRSRVAAAQRMLARDTWEVCSIARDPDGHAFAAAGCTAAELRRHSAGLV